MKKIFLYFDISFFIMTDKNISDDELDNMLDAAFKENEAKRDHCGTTMPTNKEVGVQRTQVKLKKE